MTTYNAISDSTLSQDKPFTQSTSRALRDNPIAIGEGASGAPKIAHAAITSGAFRADTGASGIAHTSGNPVAFATETFDVESWYNNSTYRYTPLVAGLYQVTAYVAQGTGGTATGATYTLRKNGSSFGPTAAINAANVPGMPLTTLVQMNGNTDYLDVQASYSGGSLTLSGGNSIYFAAVLVGRTS